MKERFDLCVIGSGPAGIIVVLEYIRLNPSSNVLLVEYGFPKQKEKNSLDDSIQIFNPDNHHGPYECTNKGIGGTSLTWGGRCVMYDDIDFIDRPSLSGGCTWDLSLYKEVKKFLNRSAEYFECGNPIFNLKDLPKYKETRIAENFKEGIIQDSTIERWSMPTRFGKRYERQLTHCKNLTILQGYEARDFAEPDKDGNVPSLIIRNVISYVHKNVKAKNFVITAGAQESTRLLLRNPLLFKNLKSIPPALGKYYQGHLYGKIASVQFYGNPKKTEYNFIRDAEGIYLRRRFQFKSDFLLQHDLLNTAFWLDNPLYHNYKHKNGAMSFMYLVMLIPFLGKRLAPPAIAHSITKGKVMNVHKHMWNLIKDLPGSMLQPAIIFFKRYCLQRKLPGVFLYNPKNNYALNFHAEQIPYLNNRMELEPGSDRLNIHYEITDIDVNSVIKLHDELDKWLRETKCGKLEYWYKKEELPDVIKTISKDGVHQIGTTRIGNSPESGVVNKNLRIWGTSNVYVCSSSVFPTSGQANPTFFLGAFAARLANHISRK